MPHERKPSAAKKKSKPGTAEVAAARDQKGRFLRGAPPGPGRPTKGQERSTAQREIAYLSALREAIPPAELVVVGMKLLKLAKSGSIAAAKVLFEHCLPRPTERGMVEQHFHGNFERLQEFRIAGSSVTAIDAQFLRILADQVEADKAVAAEFNETAVETLRQNRNGNYE